ncbi:MAG TPA: hypothetical protein ENI23_12085, partial [bacterium]|nr:hypothetical protein [bacterium]
MMDLSMNQLRDKAVAGGMTPELVQTFTTKTQIIGVIEALQAKDKKVDPSRSGDETAAEKKSADEAWLGKRARMGRHLEKQPKVGIMISLEIGEKVGIVDSKVVDGVREFNVVSGIGSQRSISTKFNYIGSTFSWNISNLSKSIVDKTWH